MKKLPLVIGLGVGYVLGTRAGRGQYEKIKSVTTTVWQSRPMEGLRTKADETVGEMTRMQATKLTDQVADLVKGKINGNR